ncbi:DUF4097 family beta strand repeat-containing protein [Paenibacillus sp. UNC451MF]|uniref:DUF4097 family beta strand repeat-containing protein n=1 Tax=Paenibacillus sp. UNC451MF TaxID=1449063 RepID=UPI00048FC5C1|nr:DUF4097 family beta strand repeat-containing protein [Paenibacillus sp. UNC451MF]
MSTGTVKGKLFIAAGVVIVLAFFVNEQGFAKNIFSWNTKPVHIEKSIKAADIHNLIVDTGSTDVIVKRGNSDDIEVQLSGSAKRETADQVQLNVEPQSDTLKLKVENPDGFHLGINFSELKLTVELPKNLWETVKVHTSSGNVDLEELRGNVIDISASSGDVTVNEIESKQITLQAKSGNIVTKDFIAERLMFQTGSGDVNLSNGQSSIKGETKSGNIQVKMNDLVQDMDLEASSGDVNVYLENEPKSLMVQFNGGSGSGEIGWDGVTYKERGKEDHKLKGVFGAGETNLKVRTGSGDFWLGQD